MNIIKFNFAMILSIILILSNILNIVIQIIINPANKHQKLYNYNEIKIYFSILVMLRVLRIFLSNFFFHSMDINSMDINFLYQCLDVHLIIVYWLIVLPLLFPYIIACSFIINVVPFWQLWNLPWKMNISKWNLISIYFRSNCVFVLLAGLLLMIADRTSKQIKF